MRKSKDMPEKNIFFSLLLCLFVIIDPFFAQAASLSDYSDSEVIGEAFGQGVTKQEFMYYYKTAQLFTRMGEQDEERTEEDRRYEAWQNLIFLKEAKSEGVVIGREELRAELERLLSEKNIEYGTENYRLWLIGQFGEGPEIFEKRIEDLLLVNKFIQIKNDPQVSVTEEEMEQKFRNQYSSFESEYIRFESQEEAEEFLEKVQEDPRLWRDTFVEKRELGQKGSAWINMMSLEALIDLWKIPKDDAYCILNHDKGSFVVAKFYYGDAVFRLLNKKEADMEKYDEKKKEEYREGIPKSKKYRLKKAYFDDLKERADFRDYISEREFQEKKEALKKKANIVLETSAGNIELRLFPDIAYMACENFIGLVEQGYYDGVIFHRVIKDFMVQSGDPTGRGTGGDSIWGQPFADEISDDVKFDREGILAMANSGANSNKSQFFITVKPTPWLNKRHTIFGEVTSGMDVVKKIENTPTDDKDRPKEEQKIIRAYIKQ